MVSDWKTKNKIQESTLIVVTLLLALAVFLAAAPIVDYAPAVNQSLILTKINATEPQVVTFSPASVVINELMADNQAAVESPYSTYPDWIELYNTGNEAVDLSGMYLSDRLSNPTWQFPEGTVIEPDGFLLVWADGDPSLGALHTDFKLNANGEYLVLFASDGTTVVDSVQFEKQLQDVSYGRSPDGSSNWKYLTKPTAGGPNFKNSQSNISTDWPIWLIIAVALVACVLVVIKDRIQARRKK